MSHVSNRRPPLATSVSAPNIFCRPMEPAPAPLVYINGWNGVGKETVAEYLTLLLGNDNALLVDVRSVGRETTSSSSSCCGGARSSKHKHRRRHEQHPLLTPEHPRYFSPDFDADVHDLSPLPSPSFSTSSCSSPPSRSASFSSASTSATSTSCASATPTAIKPTPTIPAFTTLPSSTKTSPFTTALSPTDAPPPPTPSTPTTTPSTTTTTTPSYNSTSTSTIPPTPPCSITNLTALLTRPPNSARIAVLPACCPDTAAGRAALQTFEAAAVRAGRLFVGVVLCCPGGAGCAGVRGGLRVGGAGGGLGVGGGSAGGAGGAGSGGRMSVGMGGPMGRVATARGRVASVGRLDSVLMSSLSLSSSSLLSGRSGEAAEDGRGEDDGGGRDAVGEGEGERRMGAAFVGEGTGGYGEARGRQFSLSGTGPVAGGGTRTGLEPETGVCWARGGDPELGLARPTKAGLTVDASCLPPFEVALQIIGFVKGLQAERDAELCSTICSAATTPGEGLEGEGKLEAPPEGK